MGHSKRLFSATLALGFCLIAALSVCELGTGGGDSQGSTAADLRLTNEVSGWSEQAGSYKEYDVQGLYDIINGGAQSHADNGLIEGIAQNMSGPSGRTAELFVEDMGTAVNATALFNDQVTNGVSLKVTLPDFAESVAVGSEHLSGVQVYAHFDRYFMSLNFINYTDIQVATTDANGFLKTYQNKIE